MDWIITGASRGIGRALTHELAERLGDDDRIFALARDAEALASLAGEAGERGAIVPIPVDLSRVTEARQAGADLAARIAGGATLIHNAGLWPSRRALVDGLEASFVINCLGPLALQDPLLRAGRLSRLLVVSAGLLVKGRFDPERTPVGADFSAFRTYATTKLAGAAAMRDIARRHPSVDVAVVHPGVVNTDLGARRGLLGWLLARVKRRWESPETCARRLMTILEEPRWEAEPGEAAWYFEASRQPWPAEVARDTEAVRSAVDRLSGKTKRC